VPHASVPEDGDAGSPLDAVVAIIKGIGKVGGVGVGPRISTSRLLVPIKVLVSFGH